MKRFDARKAVLKALQDLDLYRGTKDNPMVVPMCRYNIFFFLQYGVYAENFLEHCILEISGKFSSRKRNFRFTKTVNKITKPEYLQIHDSSSIINQKFLLKLSYYNFVIISSL